MLKSINLALYVGPAVPLQVSQEVIEALTDVQVTTSSTGPAAFELKFTLSNRASLVQTLFLLSGGGVPALIRVVVAVVVNGAVEVLIDGVVTKTQIAPDTGGGGTTLSVIGEDLSHVMDSVDFSGLILYPVCSPEMRVALILLKYAMLGVVPLVIPSVMINIPLPTERIPSHIGTDLAYLRLLAGVVGYVFLIEPGPVVGTSVAYWGPMIRLSPPQPALSVDMDAETNVESISCSFDASMQKMPIILIQNQLTGVPIPIPIPAVNPLSPPLAMVPPLPKDFPIDPNTAHKSFIEASLLGLAQASNSSQATTATGTLDVLRYGQVLKPRRLVGLRGVGEAFDGLYYVDAVTHSIKRGEYKQNFTLKRNGLISIARSIPT
ncbi:hypothetical protein EYB53_021705 [Candidatus Chloroploca sp. M-50]|uniref:Uncharacterized protein n=1 Tax=Candidatus Chloroploca mongolica TaxID=2528176 RepID=A0ABS4DFZ8_9CHLR|nr:hypothetical protein [Candidatus Chloroploca mongolica]MBP1468342.1 hypothetical protein [Candidatus Chloroploca mongolica]